VKIFTLPIPFIFFIPFVSPPLILFLEDNVFAPNIMQYTLIIISKFGAKLIISN